MASRPVSSVDLFRPGRYEFSGVPEGLDAMVLADLARRGIQEKSTASEGPCIVHVARDDKRLAALSDALRFFAPDLHIVNLPAWDCLPYDRVSPGQGVAARRMAALCALVGADETPQILLTTINAILQKLPPRTEMRDHARILSPGAVVDMAETADWLVQHGYERSVTVRDPSSFAVRGGILDVFPPAHEQPIRLDFFGDTLESIRSFDAETQRTLAQLQRVTLLPVSEAILTPAAIQRFRAGYRSAFGTVTADDPVYTGVSEGHRASGMEHWLPLFYEELETVFDYAPGALLSLDHLAIESRDTRLDQIEDYFQARKDTAKIESASASPYRALPPDALYLNKENWDERTKTRPVLQLSPFEHADNLTSDSVISIGGRIGRKFAAERVSADGELFDAVVRHLNDLAAQNKQVVVACWTEGSRQRMLQMLEDHGLKGAHQVASWAEVQ
ncbi:MAG: hypothetical protein K8F25_17525, partial [Fimbriimonadaceae bacterium]|nr:hypothetical protein [Alphaproteobacteria bacterium]